MCARVRVHFAAHVRVFVYALNIMRPGKDVLAYLSARENHAKWEAPGDSRYVAHVAL